MVLEKKRLGDILIEAGLIKQEELAKALEQQKETGKKIGQVLIDLKLVDGEQIAAALSAQLGIPYVNLEDYSISEELVAKIPEKISRKRLILPIEEDENKLVLAVADPYDITVIDDIEMMTGKQVEIVIANENAIGRKLEEIYGGLESVEQIIENLSDDSLEVITDAEEALGDKGDDLSNETPVIKYVNMLLLQTLKDRASDIHLEPFEHRFVIRERIDGVLRELTPPPKQFQSAVISRIKVMAELNIAETRLPQDGRIKLRLGSKELDLRVSTLPTMFGESCVMRILDRSAVMLSLDALGMIPEVQEKFEKAIRNPNGIVMATGPTGCGKTTTLYAAVMEVNSQDVKIITVEDPVEYEIKGLCQCQVNEKVGMTFPAALRSILRQDPDIILIGEVRDVDTAQISIESALTGHLVLSTTHTNEAAGALTRFIDMGVEPFLLASTIRAIVAQRLVRVICTNCKIEYTPPEDVLKKLGKRPEDFKGHKFFKGKGCEMCAGTGFKGRQGIFEFLELHTEINDLLMEKQPANIIHKKAMELGMIPMREDGWRKALEGITTPEEVLRVAPIEAGVEIKD